MKDKVVKEELNWVKDHPLVGETRYTRYGLQRIVSIGMKGNRAIKARIKAKEKMRELSISTLREEAVKADIRDKYQTHKEKTASGKPSISIGDEIADLLVGKSKEQLSKIFTDNGYDPSKYKHLNSGMTRMTLGNLLRGRARKGEGVKIGGKFAISKS